MYNFSQILWVGHLVRPYKKFIVLEAQTMNELFIVYKCLKNDCGLFKKGFVFLASCFLAIALK
ncbi:hypothetical protein DP117_09225 [Brasilonema sp. UFV-L1]|nr:hypothetical protein [Brasilonema sp. UFV-L1]